MDKLGGYRERYPCTYPGFAKTFENIKQLPYSLDGVKSPCYKIFALKKPGLSGAFIS
jgi:hypothetical protein